MNEQTKSLANIWANRRAEDPKLGITYTFSEKALEAFAEKFAELIVQECAGIAITAASDTNFITGISEADKRALSIAVEIKHHFGVEW